MDYRQAVLCALMVVALTSAVTMAAPLDLLEIAALDDLLDHAYQQALDNLDTEDSVVKRSSWRYCRHHVTGMLCKCSSRYGYSARKYFECEAPSYLNNPWNRITRNW